MAAHDEPYFYPVLWHSVGGWVGTGYGTMTGYFAPGIRSLGYDVALSAYYGHQGSEMKWRGMRVLPAYQANYGIDVLIQHALDHFGATEAATLADASAMGLIILLGDAFTFDVPLLSQMSVAAWAPVDHISLPDVTRNWFTATGAVPIAMSRFGERLLAEAGFGPVYVPHGIDTQIFSPGDQAEARERNGVPADCFAYVMVANNIGRDGSRKAFSEQIAAFAGVRKRHDDAFLLLHTDVDQPLGVRLRQFLERNLPPGSYAFTDPYAYRKGLPQSRVASIYRSGNAVINCSYGEGFGIPVVEGQACGKPVIVTDSTAMSELCGSGWKVGYERVWHDSQGAWVSVPRIGDITDAMLEAYEHARDDDMQAKAREFAEGYDKDRVLLTYWAPAMEQFGRALRARAEDVKARKLFAPPQATRSERVEKAAGLLWVERPGSGTEIGWQDHEPFLYPVMAGLVPEGGVVLDVGAHVGHWALRLAHRAALVIAVEASPATARTLRRNIAINDLGGKVMALQFAAWDCITEVTVTPLPGQPESGSARTSAPRSATPGDVTVMAMRLDESRAVGQAIRRAGRLDLVKLDVEGADLHVLRGMRGLLEAYRPPMLIECHDVYGYYTREELDRTLRDLGYGFEVVASQPTRWTPDGPSEEVRQAEWIVATAVETGAAGA